MNIICFNAVSYAIEFAKLFLVVAFLINIPQRKYVLIAFPVSLLLLSFASIYFNFSEYSIIFGLLSSILIFVTMPEKRKIGQVILAYICICIIDMMSSAICMFILNISGNTLNKSSWLEVVVNSLSLILIVILVIIKKKSSSNNYYEISGKYILILILGGFSLALYITSIQFFGFEDKKYSYKSMVAFALSISSIIFIIICALLIFKHNQNEHLKREADMNLKMFKAQEDYYTMLLQKEDETKAFRHDIQNHLCCLNTLLKDGKYNELEEYLFKMDESLKLLKPVINTGNKLIDAIVGDISIKHNEVSLKWFGLMPEKISVPNIDLCTVFSNLLINAFEAAENAENKTVNVFIKILESNLLIVIQNYTVSSPKIINGKYISDKAASGHGYGIRNICRCLEKNNGSFDTEFEDGIFTAEVVFSNAILV